MKHLLYIFVLLPTILLAQDYKTTLIPDSLKYNADAVMRFEELHITIKGIDRAVVKHKWAITILNENGDHFSFYSNYYSNLRSLSDISGKLFDTEGKLIQKIKKKDIGDVSATDESTLLSDSRAKYFAFHCKNYPYTVEFEDEEDYNGIYILPNWQPIEKAYLSLQQSKFIVETPLDYNLRYKQINYLGNPIITNKNSILTYAWEITNKISFQAEKWQPPINELTTKVLVAPKRFSIGGYSGDMSTWDGLGKFLLTLNKGRNELPDNIKQEVHTLTDKLTTKQEKVYILYNFLQQNTRYISIQLGIGGWQPLEAKFVGEKKFGDCKALSNYMVAMLKEAGVNACYVVVKSGSGNHFNLIEDFSAPYYFDHVIACVPDKKDTIWLECTDQTMSCGYTGSFTDNRKVLMVTDTGGTIVTTPHYSINENRGINNVHASVSNDGTLSAEVISIYTGLLQEDLHDLYYHATQKQRDKYYNHSLNLPTYKVENINYKESKGRIPEIEEHISITSLNYASVTGKRLFIQPNLFSKLEKLTTDKPRKFDIVIDESHIAIDTIALEIPKGYSLESMPKNVSINNKFGFYSIEYSIKDNLITTIRKHTENENRFPASEYLELAKFYEQMYKADRAKMVFVKDE